VPAALAGDIDSAAKAIVAKHTLVIIDLRFIIDSLD
jgi:hypothetical protein